MNSAVVMYFSGGDVVHRREVLGIRKSIDFFFPFQDFFKCKVIKGLLSGGGGVCRGTRVNVRGHSL